jgi:hypothetical protein
MAGPKRYQTLALKMNFIPRWICDATAYGLGALCLHSALELDHQKHVEPPTPGAGIVQSPIVASVTTTSTAPAKVISNLTLFSK